MASETIYKFKVTLRGILPPIWRRFQVKSDSTFSGLHWVLQTVMGWDNSHLHVFDLRGQIIGDPAMLEDVEEDAANEWRVRLDQYLVRKGQKFRYEYDFGDSWDHDLVLEKILPVEAGASYPRCLAGERAGPPEDCGGIWGYSRLLQALADEADPDHEMYLEWVGEEMDPEHFDLETVNRLLKPSPRA
jgi:hypothetical protein